MRSELTRKLLEEEDTVFRQYYEAKWGNGDGGTGWSSAGGREHVGLSCAPLSRTPWSESLDMEYMYKDLQYRVLGLALLRLV